MATTRKSLSKKVRFEVFKRDAFKCQYCGAHPPSVTLHVDHINPVSKGGSNDIDNLVTSCEPCNLGKGARELSAVPQSLENKSSDVAEREAQLRGYNEILEQKRERLISDTWRVMHVFYPDSDSVNKQEFVSVKNFVEKLGVYEVLEAAEKSCGSNIRGNSFRYFCGICWNKIREGA